MSDIVMPPSAGGAVENAPPDHLLSGAEGSDSLERLLGRAGDLDLESILTKRLGDGVPGRNVPSPDNLKRFILQFLGGFFRSGDYTREFTLPQERAKRHLRRMCVRGLIEREGMRKASRYCLAFHRGQP